MAQSIYDNIDSFTAVIPKERFNDLPKDIFVKADDIKSDPSGLVFTACDYKLYKAFNSLDNKQARDIALKNLPTLCVYQDLTLKQIDCYNAFAKANDLNFAGQEQGQDDFINDFINRFAEHKTSVQVQPKIEGIVLHDCEWSVEAGGYHPIDQDLNWDIDFRIKLLGYNQTNMEIIKKAEKDKEKEDENGEN